MDELNIITKPVEVIEDIKPVEIKEAVLETPAEKIIN
jgi:hypothetical protein